VLSNGCVGNFRLHCLSAVTTFLRSESSRSSDLPRRGLHCLSAVTTFLSEMNIINLTPHKIVSPLPFGSYYVSEVLCDCKGAKVTCWSPLPFGSYYVSEDQLKDALCSASFASPLPFGSYYVSETAGCRKIPGLTTRLHCLSAVTTFLSPWSPEHFCVVKGVSIAFRQLLRF